MLVEVHILDFDEDLYGQTFSVDFLKYLRPEQKFDGIEALKAQISLDCLTAKEYVRTLDSQAAESPEPKLLA